MESELAWTIFMATSIPVESSYHLVNGARFLHSRDKFLPYYGVGLWSPGVAQVPTNCTKVPVLLPLGLILNDP